PPPPSSLFPYTTLFRSRIRGLWRQLQGSRPVLPGAVGAPLGKLGAPERHPAPRVAGLRAQVLLEEANAELAVAGDALEYSERLRSEEHTSELQSRFDLV